VGRPATVIVALVLALVMTVAAADATVPGANGWIAFTMVAPPNGDEIFVTDATGLTLIRLTNHPEPIDQQPAVSPNGKEIAFYSRRDDVTLLPDGTALHSNPGRDSEIYVMDAVDDGGDGNGDNLRRLTDNDAVDSQPSWSPDGRKLAFHSNRDGNSEIYVMDADGGGEVVRLTVNGAIDQLPHLSPDGRTVAFTSNRSGNFEIYTVSADGSGNPSRLTEHTAIDAWPDFSPDGTKLAFGSDRDGDLDIWVLSLDGSMSLVNVTNDLISADGTPTNERWPTWSPDGQQIAAWSGLGAGLGQDARIRAFAADGSGGSIDLSPVSHGAAFPDWGPAPDKKDR
jgi:Tol biopolymer transport system component